ncbi:MAG: hypothetical protein IPQ05_15545, partial [Leptospiraceae bacterium]|nr:hypothetical protein [Leptospiraceae bacterium]
MKTIKDILLETRENDFFEKVQPFSRFILKKENKSLSLDFLKWFEKSIEGQIFKFGKLQYLYFKKGPGFGAVGEERTAKSLIRALDKIPARSKINIQQISSFHSQIEEIDAEYGYPDSDFLKQELKQLYFKFMEVEVMVEDHLWINRMLEWMGSSNRYEFALRTEGFIMFFGKETIQKSKINNKLIEIRTLENELARTPLANLNIAASNFGEFILLRKCAFESSFYNSWCSLYSDLNEVSLVRPHDYTNISIMIRYFALTAYGFLSLEEAEKGSKKFIDEVVEGTLWHEIGHSISLDENLNLQNHHKGLVSSLPNTTNHSAIALKEAMADWAPTMDGVSGPIMNLIQISEKDYEKAQRMLFVYLSDYWFLNPDNDFLSKMTDLILSLLMPFINSDREIDFQEIKKNHDEIYKFLEDHFKEVSDKLLEVIESASSKASDDLSVTFTFISKRLAEMLNPVLKKEDLEGCKETTLFWQHVINSLESHSPESNIHFQECLKNYDTKFNSDLLQFISKKDALAAKSSNLREYVVESMKRKGFYSS